MTNPPNTPLHEEVFRWHSFRYRHTRWPKLLTLPPPDVSHVELCKQLRLALRGDLVLDGRSKWWISKNHSRNPRPGELQKLPWQFMRRVQTVAANKPRVAIAREDHI